MSEDCDDLGEPCEFWDEDGCYCVCGSACSCIVNTGDKLHQILADALHERGAKDAGN